MQSHAGPLPLDLPLSVDLKNRHKSLTLVMMKLFIEVHEAESSN